VDSLDLNWRRLAGRIPVAAEAEASRIVRAFKGELALTPPRSSKWGSYRWRPDLGAKIFLNRDLQPEAMLITLLHELAHAQVRSWDGVGCMPHGSEWQGRYRDLLGPFLDVPGVFSPAVVTALKNQLHKPKASCGAAPDLLRALRADSDAIRVEQLPEGCWFRLANGMEFRKGPKRRSRFACTEKKTGRTFTVHALAEATRSQE
jgi:hypothetical protein